MADSKILIPFILKWEGGYAEIRGDRGGATNMGVTLSTFQQVFGSNKTKEDLKQITDAEWEYIYRTIFWAKMKGSQINDQSVANIMADWAWHSGVANMATRVQKIVGVTADGIIGAKTIAAINAQSPLPLFGKIKERRLSFLSSIAQNNTSQRKFLKGWVNRVNAIIYGKPYFLE